MHAVLTMRDRAAFCVREFFIGMCFLFSSAFISLYLSFNRQTGIGFVCLYICILQLF